MIELYRLWERYSRIHEYPIWAYKIWREHWNLSVKRLIVTTENEWGSLSHKYIPRQLALRDKKVLEGYDCGDSSPYNFNYIENLIWQLSRQLLYAQLFHMSRRIQILSRQRWQRAKTGAIIYLTCRPNPLDSHVLGLQHQSAEHPYWRARRYTLHHTHRWVKHRQRAMVA